MKLTHLAGSSASLSQKGVAEPPPPVNASPVAGDDTATATLNEPLVLVVLANDTDADVGDVLAITAINGTAIAVAETRAITNGSITRNANGSLTFTGTALGTTVFSYTVNDGAGGTDTATVTMTVEAADPEGQVGEVALTLASGPTLAAMPVRNGVPLAIGHVYDPTHIQLTDGSDVEVPAQIDAQGYWEDGSIKHVLVQTVSDIGASTRAYKLKYGPAVNRAVPGTVATASQAAGVTTITNGPLRVTLSPQGLLTGLWHDVNGDATFAAGERLSSYGDVVMTKGSDATDYRLSLSNDAVVTIEENGPVCVRIKVVGHLRSVGGTNYAQAILRYKFFAGSRVIHRATTFRDNRPELTAVTLPNSTYVFSALEARSEWGYEVDGTPTGKFALEAADTSQAFTADAVHYQHVRGDWIFEDGLDGGDQLTSNIDGVNSAGKYPPGVVAISGSTGSRHLALCMRNFWQQYPAELYVDGPAGRIVTKFFSSRGVSTPDLVNPMTTWPVGENTYKTGNLLYFNREGSQKTYHERLVVSSAAITDAQMHALASYTNRNRVELQAPLSHYRGSLVYGDLDAGDSVVGTQGVEAWALQSMYTPSVGLATVDTGNGNRGLATNVGWNRFGNRIRPGWERLWPNTDGGSSATRGVRIPSFYNGAHIGGERFVRSWLRTGDDRWLGIAFPEYQHFMDFSVRHTNRAGYWNTGGLQQPAGELHQKDHQIEDNSSRNTHKGHWHASCLPDAWMLLGDEQAKDVMNSIAGWHQFGAPYFFPQPFVNYVSGGGAGNGEFKEAERDYGWPLYVQNEYVRMTGDHAYHRDVAARTIKWLIEWWQRPKEHIGYNPNTNVQDGTAVVSVADAATGTGYWIMDRMDNGLGNANGTNPWMASSIFTQIIRWWEAEKRFIAAGHPPAVDAGVMWEMMYQCMNFCVVHAYINDTVGFAYAEVRRTTYEGWNQLVYPLLYMHEKWTADNLAGTLTNPAWHTTQSNWLHIAQVRLQWWKVRVAGSDTQSGGFYGYEELYPKDCIPLAKRLGVW